MFRDFGSSSQRHRIPREHSPFGSLNRSPRPHPMFPSRADWEGELFHQATNHPKSSEPSSHGHVERIIPIQIVGSPSPPPQQPRAESQQLNTSSAQTVEVQQPTNVPVDETVKRGSGEVSDRKYSSQRHNTTDNLQVRGSEAEKRAKSEPPLNLTSSGNTVASLPPATEASAAAPCPQPQLKVNPPQRTQLGANLTKKKSQENGGFRNIPIFVEGHGPTDGSGTPTPPPRKAHAPQSTQTPQKNRFQPNKSEQSTTPPPPPKKLTKDTMQIIQEIVEDVLNLKREVTALSFTTKTAKDYLYFDEMLTRNLIKLDTIETEGRDDIRLARRDCIKLIQQVISILEGKTREPKNELAAVVPVVAPDNDVMNTVVATEIPLPPSSNSEMNNTKSKEVVQATTTVTPIDLALTPTTSIMTPPVTTETSLEISQVSEISDSALSNITTAAPPEEEPMAIVEESVLE